MGIVQITSDSDLARLVPLLDRVFEENRGYREDNFYPESNILHYGIPTIDTDEQAREFVQNALDSQGVFPPPGLLVRMRT
jgi:hypothetical protein